MPADSLHKWYNSHQRIKIILPIVRESPSDKVVKVDILVMRQIAAGDDMDCCEMSQSNIFPW